MKAHPARKYASSTDVARLAGVSQSAVSRTFTPGASVSAATRAKVLQAASALEYQPSIIPQIMLSGKSKLIAVVLGGLGNPYYAEFLQELAQQLEPRGYKMIVLYAQSDYGFEVLAAQLASYRVDAIISALAVLSSTSASELTAFKIPIITFNSDERSPWIVSISANNRHASAQMAQHLLARGAKRFAFLCGPVDSPASQHRLAGFRTALQQAGVEQLIVLQADHFTYESGFETTKQCFVEAGKPDAIYCANDVLAMGAMDALRFSLGLNVPKDVLVAGFDDIPEASWLSYDLTTITQPPVLLVKTALRVLEKMLAQPGQKQLSVTLKGELVERSSTNRSSSRKA
ncbi:MAG: LacI family DNA-binding transcriptional regulator [Acidobacteriaceae bacterium]|nr:LacI family DNA-binding transcriptional regulator [Acidobacteriaceae bacterium]